jgi:hypothetical protein
MNSRLFLKSGLEIRHFLSPEFCDLPILVFAPHPLPSGILKSIIELVIMQGMKVNRK